MEIVLGAINTALIEWIKRNFSVQGKYITILSWITGLIMYAIYSVLMGDYIITGILIGGLLVGASSNGVYEMFKPLLKKIG